MNKFTILFLTLFLALPMAMKADSAKEKKDDTRYLVGAVQIGRASCRERV